MIYDRDQLIRSILRALDAAADIGQSLPEQFLHQETKNEGRPKLKMEELGEVLNDLAKADLIKAVSRIPGTRPQWIITGTGRNFYAQSTT